MLRKFLWILPIIIMPAVTHGETRGGGVRKIIAGTNISVSPANGSGNVTIADVSTITINGPSGSIASIASSNTIIPSTVIYTANGRLGVGISSPAAVLDVLGTNPTSGNATDGFNVVSGTGALSTNVLGGNGGAITIKSGQGGALAGSLGGTSGNGGGVTIAAANGGDILGTDGTGGNGGSVTISAGAGSVDISGGAAVGGSGGSLNLSAGSGGTNDGNPTNGGNVIVTAGAGQNGGANGNFVFYNGSLGLPNGSITASSGTFKQTGNTSYSIVTSSGINITTGTLNMQSGAQLKMAGSSGVFIAQSSVTTLGSFFGDGSQLSGVERVSSTTVSGFAYTTAQATFITCATTVTITTNGNRVAVWFSGTAASSQVTLSTIGLNVLQDGAFITGYTSAKGFSAASPTINTQNANLGFYTVLAAPSAASHSYCLSAKVSGGTFSFDTTDTQPQFGVKEIK